MSPLLPDGPIDSLGVRAAVLATPDAVAAAGTDPVDVPPFAGVHGMVLVASGADAIVAQAAQALVAPWSPVPVFVHHGPGLPDFVSDEWRCVFISSGATREATSTLRAAVERRAVLTAVGAGDIVDGVAQHGGDVVPSTDDVPAPRYGFSPMLVRTLRLLDGLSALATPLGGPGLAEAVDAAVAQLRARRTRLDVPDGEAARLARRIGRTMVLVAAAGPVGAVAARRWKEQVNDDVKAPAFDLALPGALAHELSGWGQHGDMTRQVFSLVELRHDHEHHDDVERFPAVEAMLDEVVHDRHVVRAEGEGPLAQLLDLVFVGDLVSWHLAQENEIDPGPRGIDTLGA
ncbi:MAG: SIS domain-containing protein [Acidimicrobiia bacterium]